MGPPGQLVARLAGVGDPAAKCLTFSLQNTSWDLLGRAAGDGCEGNISLYSGLYSPPGCLTFAGEVRSEPLGRCVVEETLGVSEAHGEVARVAGVLQHRLQGELLSITGTIVGSVLHSGGRGTVH